MKLMKIIVKQYESMKHISKYKNNCRKSMTIINNINIHETIFKFMKSLKKIKQYAHYKNQYEYKTIMKIHTKYFKAYTNQYNLYKFMKIIENHVNL